MFIKLLIISAAFLALAVIGLAIRMLLKRGSDFPETHIGHNKEMRKRKIYCAKTQQVLEDKAGKAKHTDSNYPICDC